MKLLDSNTKVAKTIILLSGQQKPPKMVEKRVKMTSYSLGKGLETTTSWFNFFCLNKKRLTGP